MNNLTLKRHIRDFINHKISYKELYSLISLDLPDYYDLNIFRSFHKGKITSENFVSEMKVLDRKLTVLSGICPACGDGLINGGEKVELTNSGYFYQPESEEAKELEKTNPISGNRCHPATSYICTSCKKKIFNCE